MSSVDHGNENEPAAIPADQIAVDGSVGSDTEPGALPRPDSTTIDGTNYQHHARSNSVKKPTLFKAVSVTKNFLAKAGTPPTPNAKVNGDNATATVNGGGQMPPVPRPRLVAKSSGTKQGKGHFGSRNGAGPDPMQVWNRNRATPQHPPKHLTDEELKQQYGIHLATRIQADADGKEAKWADIDDDEDDWAPETIEWNDGTKIELSKNDTVALLAEQQAAEEAARRREDEEKKAKAAKAAAEKKQTSSVGPNATVLKPRSAQTKPGTPLVLKTPTEKPTLVSKPTSSTPAKSPWAPLPAIDKVAPIDINPPIQSSAARPQPNGVLASPAVESPLQPALEIAADSFKRGGPESQKDTVGQLYNDKSGKYEPAGAGRRGSVRKDGNFRAPSVLQRGGPIPDASALIESNRLSQDENDHEARRKSSTFSAESGAFGRRQSMHKTFDKSLERRESQHSQAIISPVTSTAQLATAESPSQDARAPGAYRAGQGVATQNTGGERDDVALQRQLMKEKRDQAIKRRQEEEAREEAEKQERIRKRLEAMGPPPEKEKKEAPMVIIEKRPTETPVLETVRPEEKDSVSKGITSPPQSPSNFPKSPPKPPMPSASGEPLQYGMMKVHAPGPRDPLQQVNDTLTAEKVKLQAPTQKVSRHTFDQQPEVVKAAETISHGLGPLPPNIEQRDQMERESMLRQSQNQRISPPETEFRSQQDYGRASPLVNGTLTPTRPDHLFSRSPELTNQRPQGDLRQQPWNDGTRDARGYSWNTQQLLREPNSVWGVPNQLRPIGNSPFDRTIQRPQSRHQDQYSPALAPIGPPKHFQQPKDVRDSRPALSASPSISFEESQNIHGFSPAQHHPAERRDVQNHFLNDEHKLPSPHLPTGAQYESQRNGGRHLQQSNEPSTGLSAWQDFPTALAAKEGEERRQALREREARKAEEARTGVAYQPQMHFKEKWSQVEIAEHGRKVVNVHESLNTLGRPQYSAPQPTEIRGPSFVNSTDIAHQTPGGLGRGSRFFPTTGRLQPYGQAAGLILPHHRRSDSPPPAETESHPVFGQATRRIVVRMPFQDRQEGEDLELKEKPKVKLPPAGSTPAQSPQPAPAQLSLRPTPQPLVNNPSWQERFNSMLGNRKMMPDKSPERRMAQTVDSVTKEPLDQPSPKVQAAVTLPPRGAMQSFAEVEVASQDLESEEALFEPAAGSRPSVHFPATLGSRAWGEKSLQRSQLRELSPAPEVDAATTLSVQLPDTWTLHNQLLVFINLWGMSSSKSVPMQPPFGMTPPAREIRPQHSNQGQHNPAHKPKQTGKGYKSRDPADHAGQNRRASHNPSQKGTGAGPRNNYHRSSIGQHRAQVAT